MIDTQMYKVATSFHIGGKTGENEALLEKGDRVSFDGTSIVREDGTKIKLEYANSWRAALKAGWLVQVSGAAVRDIDPTPAPVVKAPSRSEFSNGAIKADMESAGNVKKASKPSSEAKPFTGKLTRDSGELASAQEGDGIVVGKLKNPSKSQPIEIGNGDDKIRSALDTSTRVEIERFTPRKVASGDVEDAIEGDDLEDLLPDAVSTGRPIPKSAGVRTSSGSSEVGGQDDGVVVGRIGKETAPTTTKFEWDTSIHWKRRVKLAVDNYNSDIQALNMILAQETPAVRKEILFKLYGGGESE